MKDPDNDPVRPLLHERHRFEADMEGNDINRDAPCYRKAFYSLGSLFLATKTTYDHREKDNLLSICPPICVNSRGNDKNSYDNLNKNRGTEIVSIVNPSFHSDQNFTMGTVQAITEEPLFLLRSPLFGDKLEEQNRIEPTKCDRWRFLGLVEQAMGEEHTLTNEECSNFKEKLREAMSNSNDLMTFFKLRKDPREIQGISDFSLQFDEESTEHIFSRIILCLTSNGLYVFSKNRPGDILTHILLKGKKSDFEKFKTNYSYATTIRILLMIYTSCASTEEEAELSGARLYSAGPDFGNPAGRKILFLKNENDSKLVDECAKHILETLDMREKKEDFWNKCNALVNQHNEIKRKELRDQLLDFDKNPPKLLEGVQFCVARLIRPIWNKPIIFDGNIFFSEGELNTVLKPLMVLENLLNRKEFHNGKMVDKKNNIRKRRNIFEEDPIFQKLRGLKNVPLTNYLVIFSDNFCSEKDISLLEFFVRYNIQAIHLLQVIREELTSRKEIKSLFKYLQQKTFSALVCNPNTRVFIKEILEEVVTGSNKKQQITETLKVECYFYFNEGDKYLYEAKAAGLNGHSQKACEELLKAAQYWKHQSDIEQNLISQKGILSTILAKAKDEGIRHPSFLNNIVEIHWKCSKNFSAFEVPMNIQKDEEMCRRKIWSSLSSIILNKLDPVYQNKYGQESAKILIQRAVELIQDQDFFNILFDGIYDNYQTNTSEKDRQHIMSWIYSPCVIRYYEERRAKDGYEQCLEDEYQYYKNNALYNRAYMLAKSEALKDKALEINYRVKYLDKAISAATQIKSRISNSMDLPLVDRQQIQRIQDYRSVCKIQDKIRERLKEIEYETESEQLKDDIGILQFELLGIDALKKIALAYNKDYYLDEELILIYQQSTPKSEKLEDQVRKCWLNIILKKKEKTDLDDVLSRVINLAVELQKNAEDDATLRGVRSLNQFHQLQLRNILEYMVERSILDVDGTYKILNRIHEHLHIPRFHLFENLIDILNDLNKRNPYRTMEKRNANPKKMSLTRGLIKFLQDWYEWIESMEPYPTRRDQITDSSSSTLTVVSQALDDQNLNYISSDEKKLVEAYREVQFKFKNML